VNMFSKMMNDIFTELEPLITKITNLFGQLFDALDNLAGGDFWGTLTRDLTKTANDIADWWTTFFAWLDALKFYKESITEDEKRRDYMYEKYYQYNEPRERAPEELPGRGRHVFYEYEW